MVLQHTADKGLVGSVEQGAAPGEGLAVPLGRKHVDDTNGVKARRTMRERVVGMARERIVSRFGRINGGGGGRIRLQDQT